MVLANADLIDKLRVAVYHSIPFQAPTVGSWRRFSLPSGATRRFSSRSSLSAINSAFFYEKVVKVKADVAAFISFSPLDPAADRGANLNAARSAHRGDSQGGSGERFGLHPKNETRS